MFGRKKIKESEERTAAREGQLAEQQTKAPVTVNITGDMMAKAIREAIDDTLKATLKMTQC